MDFWPIPQLDEIVSLIEAGSTSASVALLPAVINRINRSRSMLKGLVRPIYRRLPQRVKIWFMAQSNIAAVESGQRLVPEAALERKYDEALDYLARADDEASIGDYLEFGVYNGSSLACAYRSVVRRGLGRVRLFGFDSFEGLPEQASVDDGGNWAPGAFSMTYGYTRRFLTQQGVDWNRVTLVRGWFQDTLNQALVQKHAIRKASMIMVDCDLYTSTKPVLEFCAPLITDRAVVFFDDWFAGDLAERNLGEKRAFGEFLTEHPEFAAEEFGDYGGYSKAFVVTRRTR